MLNRSVRVVICLAELHIPASTSLKRKRQVIKSVVQRMRNRFNVSVSEVGCADLLQRSELGLAIVCHNSAGADSIQEQVYSFLEREPELEIISFSKELY